jgi:hypothetical protein
MITETLSRSRTPTEPNPFQRDGGGSPVSRELHSGRVTSLSKQALGLLVSVSSTHYCASTSDLSPSDLLGALPGNPVGAIILERASRLDAFSGYHFRT